MWKLSAPTDTATGTFMTCISTVEDIELKNRYLTAVGEIFHACVEFEKKVTVSELYQLIRPLSIGNGITKKDMTWLYNNKLVSGPGRLIYDKLLDGARLGLCPLCGARDAATLDHYLGKSSHIALSVVPVNLVPACTGCNTSSKPAYPQSNRDQMIHPYFDDVESERWLRAKVLQYHSITEEPATFEYYVDPPVVWKTPLPDRMQNHFDVFQLSSLYATKASRLFSDRQFRLSEIFHVDGPTGVRDELQKEFRSCQHSNINSWQTATYDAAWQDSWFCSGGFGLLPASKVGL